MTPKNQERSQTQPLAQEQDQSRAAVKLDPQRAKSLESALNTITKTFGEGSIMRLGDAPALHAIEVIPTGALSLDLALGVGGIPRGRIVEIYGPESSGKTTVVLHVIANAQKAGGLAAFIDAEHALDPAYAKRLGVNLDDLLVSQPDSGEEALTICETLARSNAVDVIVVDSVAALVPKAELEGEMGMATMGMQARLMSQALRKLTGVLAKARTACIFTNQIREKVGVVFGNPETTPGGKALKFYASIRIEVRKKDLIKDNAGNTVGSRIKAKVVKNKLAPPFAEAEFDILFNQGIDKVGSVLEAALTYGVIEKRGSWLQFEGEMLGQGREATLKLLTENPQLLTRITEAVYNRHKEKAFP